MSNQGNISNKIDELLQSHLGKKYPRLLQSILSLVDKEVKRVVKEIPIFQDLMNDLDINQIALEEQILKVEIAWNEHWEKKLEESNQEAYNKGYQDCDKNWRKSR